MSLERFNNVKRKIGLPWQHIDNQSLILNPENHEAHELNEVASLVWSKLDGKTELTTIISQIAAEYEVGLDELNEDVLSIVNSLVELELVECL